MKRLTAMLLLLIMLSGCRAIIPGGGTLEYTDPDVVAVRDSLTTLYQRVDNLSVLIGTIGEQLPLEAQYTVMDSTISRLERMK